MCPYRLLGLALILLSSLQAARAETFDENGPLYEANVATVKPLTVDCWFRPGAQCPPGAYVFDKLLESTLSAYRLEIGAGRTLQFIDTAGDVAQAPLPETDLVHVLCTIDPVAKTLGLSVNGAPAVLTPWSSAQAIGREEGPLRLGGDFAGGHRFVGEILRFSLFNRVLTETEAAASIPDTVPGAGLGQGEMGGWDLRMKTDATGFGSAGNGPKMELARPFSPLQSPPEEGLLLWYDHPAWEWVQALPIGNGRLGGMVFGGVSAERIGLNEGTIWAGSPYNPINPTAGDAMPKIRDLLLQGKSKEAMDLWKSSAMAVPIHQPPYQTLGNLRMRFQLPSGPVERYCRTLDLDGALSTVTYAIGGVTYTREVFVSAPDQALIIRITADQPGSISFVASFDSLQRNTTVSSDGKVLVFDGCSSDAEGGIPGKVKFSTRLSAQNDGGTVETSPAGLKVSDANSVTLLLTAATSYISWKDVSGDADAISKARLDAMQNKAYADLLTAHQTDYRSLFRRVAIDLGTGTGAKRPTDERIRRFSQGDDPGLAALLYQYGRYLLISCSRPGGQAATLQGLWNESLTPPWGSRYTVNINTEMNYWPAESANLSECTEPLIDLVQDLSNSGVATAQQMYHASGWVCHHNTDLWRSTAPIDGLPGMWVMGGAWLSTHLWEHYQFTQDQAFLEKAYPIMKGAALFVSDVLSEEPTHHWLVVNPSYSPENGGLCVGSTIDNSIARDIFAETVSAAKILGVDPDLQEKLSNERDHLAPFQIGRLGQLQEWLEDKDSPDDHNRHVSQLYGVFPSNQITSETPDLFAAAKQSLQFRGDGATGWSLAWKINWWARFLDGDHAYLILNNLLGEPGAHDPVSGSGGGLYPNLFDAHPPFQIDGNFGFTSGIDEMLLQSHEKTEQGDFLIRLLPALPKAWPRGSVTGLRARGGFEINMQWSSGQLNEATIRSPSGGQCVLSYEDKLIPVSLAAGKDVHLNFPLP